MQKLRNFLFITLVAIMSVNVGVTKMAMARECPITPALYDVMPLPKFQNSNNLRRLTGALNFAKGKPMILLGTVLDRNCVPIPNAVVEIWQRNSNGVYNFDIRNSSQWDPNFSSTGTTVVDNMGKFAFYTVFPGRQGGVIPSVNFRVRHADFPLIETRFYFSGYMQGGDGLIHTISSQELQRLIAHKINSCDLAHEYNEDFVYYEVQIIMDGYNKYLTY